MRTTTLALTALLAPASTLAAVDIDDLLPVDEAFVLRAEATAPDRIELSWTIADGYYLYRHRMGAEPVDGGFQAGPGGLQLPAGKRHTDEFFGEVETYRGRVTGTLPGTARAARTELKIRYQGCADIGICYPPQTRTVAVTLPAAPPAAAVAGSPDAGFAALGQALGSGGIGSGALALPGATDALPLPEEQAFAFEAIAGDGDTLLMRFTPAPGYYLYRDRSSFKLEAEGIRAGAPRWPQGVPHNDGYFGDVVVYFDQVDVPLPLHRSHAGPREATLTATFQGCQDEGICYPPMTRSVRVSLPAGTVAAAPAADAGADAVDVDGAANTGTEEDVATALAKLAAGDPTASDDPVGSVPGTGAATADGSDAIADNAVRSTPPAPARGGLALALLLALAGGLLLNVMPCVLPILSLKVLGLAQGGASRASARRHALWYTAGVLVAFAVIGLVVLALRAAGQAMGWGFQLQQPGFVAALVLLMAAVGLSLSGVFSVGGSANLGHGLAARTGPVGDFFTGVLACVVASPCIAPFMGGALAFAFTASPAVALLVFLALGLGLALPFLLVGFVPALADRLPRPGAWMETLKQVLAFPMYLTAIWLAWVLGRQRGVDAMALVAVGVAVMALALWWLERARIRGGWLRRLPAIALLLAALSSAWMVGRLPAPALAAATAEDGSVPYSAGGLRSLREAGTPVFVNMTADWCVTCKANERSTLSSDAFRDALRRTGATYMVGDWTNVDPEISAFLERHRAVGVPLYVVYPGDGGEGEVLPAMLDRGTAVAALERAAH
ncbi:protein-disulfide reductase DsbD family protein [Luteimonas terricola]|uniref:Cytochrome c biogenesis protein n=1 Tax=Luteimonas terricola TaxID=645597 RepID=A0ABQ2ELL7_9GAMM|nr:protein-disulfide reductase DsbD [Luteimonas terricola]GGK13789.1 cytochrome c biogenesis protein [Luteimonas terricola]